MSLIDPLATGREIVRALSGALQQALADDAPRARIVAARDVAQVLSLPGLERVMEACVPHAGRPRPAELTPVLERVRRLVADSADAGGIESFQAADRELDALAGQLQAMEWSETAETLEGRAPAVATLSLADVLEDLPLADPASPALRVRLTAPVAAALRAALDWLTPPRQAPQPLQLRAEDSMLEITRDSISHAGLAAADKVLSTVGGILGPATADARVPGPWTLRVPTFAGRGTYLMVTQGSLRLALPWHSVQRVCLVAASDLNSALRTAGYPVLEPLMPLGRAAAEYPVVLVAHGLKRAYLVADRLVWRLRAQPLDSERVAPVPVLSGAVETDEGDVFWAVDPGRMLARVEVPTFNDPGAGEATAEALPVLGPESVEPLLEATDDEIVEPAAAEASVTEIPVIEPPNQIRPQPAHEPRSSPATPMVARDVAAPERAGSPGPTAAPERPRALVAEDSIMASLFLTRMLEQRGFEVGWVANAAALKAAQGESWSLYCIDVELPDARPEAVFGELIESQRQRGAGVPIVALVRDDEDVTVARAVGVEWTLHKPFHHESLDRLLERLGLVPGSP